MQRSLKVFHYFINWNDSYYLPFIKRHYGSFCERIIMYDNYSTDHSVELASSLGMEVRQFGNPGELHDAEYIKVKDNCWKEARGQADFVIVCDADEFLAHPQLVEKLKKYKKRGITLPRTKGFDMISEDLPIDNIFEIKTGFRNSKFNKPIIFDPNLIEEINFNYGSHNHKPKGKISKSWGSLRLYHFRMIGGFDRLRIRHEEYLIRLSEFNRQKNFGKEYWMDEASKKKEWDSKMKKARTVI